MLFKKVLNVQSINEIKLILNWLSTGGLIAFNACCVWRCRFCFELFQRWDCKNFHFYVWIKEGRVSVMVMGDILLRRWQKNFTAGSKLSFTSTVASWITRSQKPLVNGGDTHSDGCTHTRTQSHMHTRFPTIFSHISQTLSCFSWVTVLLLPLAGLLFHKTSNWSR